MPTRGSGSNDQTERLFAELRDRLVRAAKRSLGASASILMMLCERWGDQESRRAARAVVRSLRSARPMPLRWRLDAVLEALTTSGATEIDVSAHRLARHLRDLVSDQEELIEMARLLGRSIP